MCSLCSWLPQRSEVGERDFRQQYTSFADLFCTCDFGGAFLCSRYALKDTAPPFGKELQDDGSAQHIIPSQGHHDGIWPPFRNNWPHSVVWPVAHEYTSADWLLPVANKRLRSNSASELYSGQAGPLPDGQSGWIEASAWFGSTYMCAFDLIFVRQRPPGVKRSRYDTMGHLSPCVILFHILMPASCMASSIRSGCFRCCELHRVSSPHSALK